MLAGDAIIAGLASSSDNFPRPALSYLFVLSN